MRIEDTPFTPDELARIEAVAQGEKPWSTLSTDGDKAWYGVAEALLPRLMATIKDRDDTIKRLRWELAR